MPRQQVVSMRYAIRFFVFLGLAITLAGFGGYVWLRSYLHSEEFRVFIAEHSGKAMEVDVELEPLYWQGMRASTQGLKAEGLGFVRSVEARGIEAGLSVSEIGRGVWLINDLMVRELQVVLEAAEDQTTQVETADSPAKGEQGGFFGRLLPDKTEVGVVTIANLDMKLNSESGSVDFMDGNLKATRRVNSDVYDLEILNALIDVSWMDSPLSLRSAKGRYANGRLYLQESHAGVFQRGLLTMNGELSADALVLEGTLKGIGADELLEEDWKKRISGDLYTEFRHSSSGDGSMTRGKLTLERGVLTALPVLDELAAYVDSRRFRQIHLSEAHVQYHVQEDRLELTDIVIASEGLMRVLGKLTVENENLDGLLRVGIMPALLKHIPGAETKVFLRGEKGLRWTTVRITGTVDKPEEDLSERLVAAAGKRMFEVVPETGQQVLKFAHQAAEDLPQAAVDAGNKILDEGSDVIEGSANIIREGVGEILDLIPGGNSSSDDE